MEATSSSSDASSLPAAAVATPAAAAASGSEVKPAATPTGETTKGAIADRFAQAALLDMVFVMDCTGSMGSYIAAAQATIADIVQQIVSAEKADVRFALVAYRDHPPQESTYVVNVHGFSSSVKTMRTNLDGLSANGGGDGPEAVVDGLHAALKLDYRGDATKVVILIADAPPHGLQTSGDGFPNGCPCGLDPMTVCREMAENNISLYCIGCEPSLSPYKNFFMAMAHVTGGQYCPLGDARVLSSAVVSGVREEMSLATTLAEVKAAAAECEHLDEIAQAEFVHRKLKEKNVRSKQMKGVGAASATQVTAEAIDMSKASSLAEIRAKYSSHTTHERTSAPSASREKKKSAGGLFGSIGRMFSSRSKACEGDDIDPAGEGFVCARMSSAASLSVSDSFARVPASAMPSGYTVEEAEVSMEQTARLMNKARVQRK